MIHNESRFAHWLPAGFDGKFDWDFLLPAWAGTKVEPMDFDAVVERRRHFLIFETKIPGKDIPQGQAITLTEMWRRPNVTIMQIAGKSPNEITGYAMYAETEKDKSCRVGDRVLVDACADDVVARAHAWFVWATDNPVNARWRLP